MKTRFDVAVVGAGIAGASLAAEVAGSASVLLIEAEDRPGYHSTGRSAAFWSETYGGPLVQPLTTASGPVLQCGGFLSPRRALHLAHAGSEALLARMQAQFEGRVELRPVEREALDTLIPGLKPGWNAGLLEPSCCDIDVAALHTHFLATSRSKGATLLTSARLMDAVRVSGRWMVTTTAGTFEADRLVNAAGAWADEVARLSGARPLGIQPYRRTVAQLRIAPPAPAELPLVIDAALTFYFKPEAGGRIWLSPHDETPCDPCDSAAEEMDVALAIDRLDRTVDWRVERVETRWAGLRSFAPDRAPVFGFDESQPGFFWCAGQGGFGIQTSPASARLCAALLLDEQLSVELGGVDPSDYAPARFRN